MNTALLSRLRRFWLGRYGAALSALASSWRDTAVILAMVGKKR